LHYPLKQFPKNSFMNPNAMGSIVPVTQAATFPPTSFAVPKSQHPQHPGPGISFSCSLLNCSSGVLLSWAYRIVVIALVVFNFHQRKSRCALSR